MVAGAGSVTNSTIGSMKRRRASGMKPISSRTPKNCSNGA
jgi:hypothetical protein